jgi:hypothetical protein
MNLKNRLTEQRDASDALDSRDRRLSLSTTQAENLRAALLSDSYLFAKKICGHEDLIDEYHMVLSYAVCGLFDRLIEVLDADGFNSYVLDQFRDGLRQRIGDWHGAAGRARLEDALSWQNHRWSRATFKSSDITHAGATFIATVNPNRTIKITHAVDPKAWAFCEQIGNTVKSGRYRDLFPDRIPANEVRDITIKAINLGGRTISHPQKTINAAGYKSKEEAAHFDTFFTDDLVNEGNSSPQELSGVRRWLSGLSGMFMPTKNIWRIEVGTKHDEEDDDEWLTHGARADTVFTTRVPIEVHDGPIKNLLKRGRPTLPLLFDEKKITKLQRHVLADENEVDGAQSWRCNYLLNPSAGGGRLFPPSLIDNPDHWWLGPFEHPRKGMREIDHYLVARFKRDEEGNPVPRSGRVIFDADGELLPDWRANALRLVFDPWVDLDRVGLVDPAFASRTDAEITKDPDNWAVSAVATDHETVGLQLETQADRTGIEGWISALAEMDSFYHFRIIAFDGTAWQDTLVQNLMKTDPRLRKLRRRMVPVKARNVQKAARMRAGLLEPLLRYQFLLRPDAAGLATRTELKNIRGLDNDTDGIADSLSMHRAVNKPSQSKAQRKRAEEEAILNAVAKNRSINPYLGVPTAA